MAHVNVCQHNKYGFCKYREKCKLRHVTDVCEAENCDVEHCLQRHPKQCRFYREFERCKFGEYCFFSHARRPKKTDDELQTVKARLEILENKNVELASDLAEKSLEIKELEIRLNDISAKCDTAVETTNIIVKEVTEIVTNAVIKRQDAFEEQNSARFDALDQQLVALLGLLRTRSSALHHPQDSRQSPTSSQETPQHSQQIPQQPQPSHHQNPQTTLPHQTQQQPGLSLRNNFDRDNSQNSNLKFTCDLCGQTFDTDRAKKNHVRNNHQM